MRGDASRQKKHSPLGAVLCLEAPPGIGPGMKVLQTSALPLGYGAGWGSYRGSRITGL